MSCPRGYVAECAPLTLAALTGLELEEAARLLWPHRATWWDPRRAHPAGSMTFGTSEDALADVLLRLGFDVELWTGEGELVADPGVYRRHLAQLVHGRTLEVRRVAPAPAREASADVCKPRAPIEGPTLRTWLERHRGGGWWAVCVATEASAHVMPVWGSQILVDHERELERYGDATVYRALRVFQPRGVTA